MSRTVLTALAVLVAGSTWAQGGAPPRGKTEVTWYGHSAFVVRTPKGTVLAIDPWFSNPTAKKAGLQPPSKIDYLLLTHAHPDHSSDAVALGKATHAAFVGSADLGRVLVDAGYPMDPSKLFDTAGNAGGTLKLDDEVSVTMVPAFHSSAFPVDGKEPEYGGAPVGFIIQIRGGPTIYDTGDTALFSDMQLIPRGRVIDLMLACIGDHFTMGPVDAAQAVKWVHPRAVVPTHFGTFPALTGTPAAFSAALRNVGAHARMIDFKPGETKAF